MNEKKKFIMCNKCGYIMTEKEYEDFPQCPDCYGSYVTEKTAKDWTTTLLVETLAPEESLKELKDTLKTLGMGPDNSIWKNLVKIQQLTKGLVK